MAAIPEYNLDELYFEQYQLDSVSESALHAYDEIGDELFKAFGPETAMDVGCGGGALIRAFCARGVKAQGIEGSVHGVKLLPNHILQWDLRKPFRSVLRYDLVTCFDVAEHIEEEFADTLCDTLVGLLKPEGVLCFGAAGIGQDGLHHVNCQEPTYWQEKLARRGCVYCDRETNTMKWRIEQRDHSFLWWVHRNIQVFRHA